MRCKPRGWAWLDWAGIGLGLGIALAGLLELFGAICK